MTSSRVFSHPRDRTLISCIAGRFFITEPPGKTSSVVYTPNYELAWGTITPKAKLAKLCLYGSFFDEP